MSKDLAACPARPSSGQGSPRDPLFDDADDLVGQSPIRRHLEFAVVSDGLYDQTGIRLSRDGHSLGREEVGPRIEGESALGFTGFA